MNGIENGHSGHHHDENGNNHVNGKIRSKTRFQLDGKFVGVGEKTYFIVEGGNNHRGNLERGKLLVEIAKGANAECVKFQKRKNEAAMSAPLKAQIYDSPHSYGRTYLEHREAVELTDSDFVELMKYCKAMGITGTASAWDLESAAFLQDVVNVPFFKVASGDLKHLELFEYLCKTRKPLVISTGMANLEDIKKTVRFIERSGSVPGLVIFACTSNYPCKSEHLNIRSVTTLAKKFPQHVIGWSGHENNIDPTLWAVAAGACVVERHVTYDKKQKGNDHQASLEPAELRELISRLEELDETMGDGVKDLQEGEKAAYKKLGKSLCTRTPVKRGDRLTRENLISKSPGYGICPNRIFELIEAGAVFDTDLQVDQIIGEADVLLSQNYKFRASPLIQVEEDDNVYSIDRGLNIQSNGFF